MVLIKFIFLGFLGTIPSLVNREISFMNKEKLSQDTLIQNTISELEPILFKRESLLLHINKKKHILDSISNNKNKLNDSNILAKEVVRGRIDEYLFNTIINDYKLFKNLSKQDFKKKIGEYTNEILKIADEVHVSKQVELEVDFQIKQLQSDLQKLNQELIKEQGALSFYENKLSKLLLSEEREYFDIMFYGNNYNVFLANSRKHHIKIHSNTSGALQPIRYTLNQMNTKKLNPVFLMNAGMYNEDGSAVGLLIEENRQIKSLDVNQSPIADNFHMYPNGVFYTLGNKFYVSQTADFRKLDPDSRSEIEYGTQSGPMLVINGKIHPKFTFQSKNTNIRNGIGILEDYENEKAVLIISEGKVNLYEFALLFQFIFKCSNALYLDGAISKAYYTKNGVTEGSLGGNLGPVLSVSPINN